MKILTAFFLIVLLPFTASALETGSDGKLLNGMAPLYIKVPATTPLSVSAQLTLPLLSSNHGWYANWIMMVSNAPGAAGFIQAGMIRMPSEPRSLHAFIAWQHPGDSSITFKELQAIDDAPHRLAIDKTERGYVLRIDGTDLAAPIEMSLEKPYAQIGPEVYLENDAISGSVSALKIRSLNDPVNVVAGNETCRYVNHGVALIPRQDGSFRASGTFARSQPSRFVGDCTGF